MNGNQIFDMIVRVIMRRVINKGINAGLNRVTRGRDQQPRHQPMAGMDDGYERPYVPPQDAAAQRKQAKRAAKAARRSGHG